MLSPVMNTLNSIDGEDIGDYFTEKYISMQQKVHNTLLSRVQNRPEASYSLQQSEEIIEIVFEKNTDTKEKIYNFILCMMVLVQSHETHRAPWMVELAMTVVCLIACEHMERFEDDEDDEGDDQSIDEDLRAVANMRLDDNA
jgi:hypothetical protein